jgi:predicted ArsR family transcriptional regulator
MDPNRAFLDRVTHARDTMPYGQRPTDTHCRIAAKLAFWRSANVTHRAIARAAKCSARTVRRALARLRTLGLLAWTRRVVVGRGWRAQIANRYTIVPKPLSSASLESIRIQCSVSLSASRTSTSAGLAEVAKQRLTALTEAWRARKTA